MSQNQPATIEIKDPKPAASAAGQRRRFAGDAN